MSKLFKLATYFENKYYDVDLNPESSLDFGNGKFDKLKNYRLVWINGASYKDSGILLKMLIDKEPSIIDAARYKLIELFLKCVPQEKKELYYDYLNDVRDDILREKTGVWAKYKDDERFDHNKFISETDNLLEELALHI